MLSNDPNNETALVFSPDQVTYDWRTLDLGNIAAETRRRGNEITGAVDAVLLEVERTFRGSGNSRWIADDEQRPADSPANALLIHASVIPGLTSDAELQRATQGLRAAAVLVVERDANDNWETRSRDPEIAEITVSENENLVYIRQAGAVGFDGMESLADLRNNWNRLIDVAGLTPDERHEAVRLFNSKVEKVPGTEV